jgi:mono/diheme cytochrome c family protein
MRKPRRLSATALAFIVPALLVGLATVALAADASPSPSASASASPGATGGALPGDPNKGQTVYQSAGCTTCHGATLAGGIGPPLHPVKNLGDTKDPLDPQYMIETITAGKQGIGGYGTMPAKGGATLSDQDVKDVAAFIIQENKRVGPVPLAPGQLAQSTIEWVTIGILAMLALTYLLSRYNMRWIARKSGQLRP